MAGGSNGGTGVGGRGRLWALWQWAVECGHRGCGRRGCERRGWRVLWLWAAECGCHGWGTVAGARRAVPGLKSTMARRQPSSVLSMCMSRILDTSSVRTLRGSRRTPRPRQTVPTLGPQKYPQDSGSPRGPRRQLRRSAFSRPAQAQRPPRQAGPLAPRALCSARRVCTCFILETWGSHTPSLGPCDGRAEMSQGPGHGARPRATGTELQRAGAGSLRHSAGAPASPTPPIQEGRPPEALPHSEGPVPLLTRQVFPRRATHQPHGNREPRTLWGKLTSLVSWSPSGSALTPGPALASHPAWAPQPHQPQPDSTARKWRVVGVGHAEQRKVVQVGPGQPPGGHAFPWGPRSPGVYRLVGGGAFLQLEKDPGGQGGESV